MLAFDRAHHYREYTFVRGCLCTPARIHGLPRTQLKSEQGDHKALGGGRLQHNHPSMFPRPSSKEMVKSRSGSSMGTACSAEIGAESDHPEPALKPPAAQDLRTRLPRMQASHHVEGAHGPQVSSPVALLLAAADLSL